MRKAVISGWGKCLPPATLTNHDLSTFMDTSDEWISSRTGIKERRVSHVDVAELCYVAGSQALACAGLQASELDAIVVCTCTPGSNIPNSASRVQQLLGAQQAAVFDLNAACTGFVYGLQTASALIQSGAMQRILLIGAERLSQLLDWTRRDTAVLFGDGAGAVILEAGDGDAGFVSAKLGCDSENRDILSVPDFGTNRERFANADAYYSFNFEGPEIFKRAVRGMGEATSCVLAQSDWQPEDVDFIVPHQANLRIIEALAKRMNANAEQVMVNIQHYGNTSAATVPIALCEALEQQRVKPGDRLLLAAFGAGLTWGAATLQWGERVEPLGHSDVALPPCEQSALQLIAPAIEGCRKANPQ